MTETAIDIEHNN